MMNLMQLKYFKAVCTFGTVSGAADYLHIAQPSVSNAIKELENEFGVMLFKRHHRGMVLTSEGEHLLRMSGELLERAERTEKIMKDMGGEKKTLILGVPPMTGSLILPNIYNKFLKNNEDINLEIVECGRQEMIKRITEDRLDMAFVSHNQQIEAGLSTHHVARLEIVCGAAKENEIAKEKSLSPKQLSDVPLVMFEDGFFQTAEIKKWFAKGEITPDILMQTAQLSTMLSIISSNTAVGFMFKKLIEKNPEIIPVSMSPAIFVNVSLVWRKDKYIFSSMRRFKEFLSKEDLFE